MTENALDHAKTIRGQNNVDEVIVSRDRQRFPDGDCLRQIWRSNTWDAFAVGQLE
jgi:hypothetical protein